MQESPNPALPDQPTAADQTAVDEDASTRQRVVQSIMRFGPSTAAELADRLGITPAAIRRHLANLMDHHDLEARDQRVFGARGRGRPAKVFVLTDTGRAAFHHTYDDLAIAALAALDRSGESGALDQVARHRMDAVTRRYHDLAEARPDAEPAVLLAEALSEDGYVASTREAGAGGDQLCQHHCPVAHVAAEFPQLCNVETELFSELLGVHVQRLATIAHGDGVCTTHIPRNQPARKTAGTQRQQAGTGPTEHPDRTDNPDRTDDNSVPEAHTQSGRAES